MWTCYNILCVSTLAIIFSSEIVTSREVTGHYTPGCIGGQRFRSTCYKLTEPYAGNSYYMNCNKAVIKDRNENDFVKALLVNSGESNAWIGADHETLYENFYRGDSYGDCYYMEESGQWHATDWCYTKRRVVCAWKPDCLEGWFGEDCDKPCHCHKENCTKNQGYCKYGCEPGWTGRKCTKEVTVPLVEHHCVKNRTHYSLLLSKDSKSFESSLVPLDVDGYPINPEQYTDGFNGSDVFEITTTDLSVPFQPNYHEKKIDSQGTTFEWSFRLRQFKSARTFGDTAFRVRCDFSDVDVIYASTSIDYKVSSLRDPARSSPLPVRLGADISLTDPRDTNNLADVSIGQPIKVVMSQQAVHGEDGTVEEDSGQLVYGSPRSCVASSIDNRVVKQLSDEKGCGLDPDLTEWFGTQPYTDEYETQPFAAFGMPGTSSMNISCSLVICSYQDYRCRQPCTYD